MKKIILLLCLSIATGTAVTAQRAAERKEEIRKGLKEQVMLSDEQVSAVMSIEDEFRPKLRAVKTDTTLSDELRKGNSNKLNEEKLEKIEKLLGKDKAEHVKKFYSGLKKTDKATKKEEDKKED